MFPFAPAPIMPHPAIRSSSSTISTIPRTPSDPRTRTPSRTSLPRRPPVQLIHLIHIPPSSSPTTSSQPTGFATHFSTLAVDFRAWGYRVVSYVPNNLHIREIVQRQAALNEEEGKKGFERGEVLDIWNQEWIRRDFLGFEEEAELRM